MRPMGQMQGGMIPAYFMQKKEKFLQQAAGMGFDLYACQDFLDQRGIVELQLGNLIDNMQNPSYINVLKVPPVQMQPPMQPMPQQF